MVTRPTDQVASKYKKLKQYTIHFETTKYKSSIVSMEITVTESANKNVHVDNYLAHIIRRTDIFGTVRQAQTVFVI